LSRPVNDRPYLLLVGGFDPSAGAGILADVKTCEQKGVYGLGVITANTFQTHNSFESIDWMPKESILQQVKLMLSTYKVAVIKLGLLPDFSILRDIRSLAAQFGNPFIVLDPVCKSSSGFGFHKVMDARLLSLVGLITPNWKEVEVLSGSSDVLEAAKAWSNHTAVLLKGGHSGEKEAVDYLIEKGNVSELKGARIPGLEKHGSGCVLASAIAAELAKEENIIEACRKGKAYTLAFLQSNEGMLGYHKT
jgi:hydroxymethylpyrimidine/phosphomethylpyrimidine kinase